MKSPERVRRRSPSPEERVRRRSPGRDEGRGRDRCGGGDRDRDSYLYSINRNEHGKEREREKRKRREMERDEEREREKRRLRELERHEEDEREREKWKRRELQRHEEDEKKKKKRIQEDEEMSLKREKWAKRWQRPSDHEKWEASTVAGVSAAPLVDTAIAAVLRQFPNLGSSETPTIQAGEQPTKCLVLKNVFDPEFALKEGSKYYMCIRDDLHQRCSMYGAVHHIHIDEDNGFVYMKFDTSRSASIAQKNLHEMPYKERVIKASFMDTRRYDSRFGTLQK